MKKKVLFVIHQLTIGGAQKSMLSALNAIDYDKYDVDLYVRKNRLDLVKNVNNKVNIIINDDKHHYYRKPYAMLLEIKIFFAGLMKKENLKRSYTQLLTKRINDDMLDYEYNRFFDHSYYHVAVSYIDGWQSRLVSEKINADRKICFHLSSDTNSTNDNRNSFFHFNTIVTDSYSSQSLLQRSYPEVADRFCVIKNYINAEEIKKQSLEPINYKKDNKIVFASCARFTKPKGFDLAIRSAKILKEKGVDFVWFFIGDGVERGNLEKMIIDNSLDDSIIITGIMANPYPIFRFCDVYVQPSREESFGLTITAALILCKPVISTKTAGGTEQIIDETNGILTGFSPKEIAMGIEKMLINNELRKSIEDKLRKIDYSKNYDVYKNQWKELLGG